MLRRRGISHVGTFAMVGGLFAAFLFAPSALLAQSGLKSTESATQIGPVAGADTLWADGMAQRWLMNNHNNMLTGGSVPVAAWPCVNAPAPGCIVVGSGASPYPETYLYAPSLASTFLQAGSSAPPSWSTYALPTTAAAGMILNATSGVLSSFTLTPTLGVSGTPGTLTEYNNTATTTWQSGATTTNIIAGFVSVPTNGHIVDCTSASITCTLHDSGVVTANVVNASSPGAGIAHFAGTGQTVTSSPVSLTADVTGALPVANGGGCDHTMTTATTDWALNGDWGTSPSIPSVGAGSTDCAGSVTVSSRSGAPALGATVTLTFKTQFGGGTGAPVCISSLGSALNASTPGFTVNPGATTLVITSTNTPTVSKTYQWYYICFPVNGN